MDVLNALDGVGPKEDYLDALASREGPSRYEPETGKLYIDDRVRAQFGPSKLADGTWAVENATYCSPPPDDHALIT